MALSLGGPPEESEDTVAPQIRPATTRTPEEEASLRRIASLNLSEEELAGLRQIGEVGRDNFFSGFMSKMYSGDLTPEQQAGMNPDILDFNERQIWDFSNRGLTGYNAVLNGRGKLRDDDIGEFMRGFRNLELNQPEAFEAMLAANPQMGLRYLASMGTGRYFVNEGIDYKTYRDRAEQLGYQMGVDAGFGEDGKQDGRAYASGYGTQWADVNNEGGRGDFLKLGTPSKVGDGVLNWVEDNPIQAVGLLATTIAAGPAASALVTAGYSTAQAAMIVAAGNSAVNTALQGGDVSDILKNSTVAAGTSGAMNYIPGFGDVYNASNAGGAFVRGSTNDALSQLIFDGSVDVEDVLKSGGINVLFETGMDLLGDAKQTNDGNLNVEQDTLNGAKITEADIERLTNTSDLYGILGEEGLLGQLGLNPGEVSIGDFQFLTPDGYLNTSAIGDTFDAIDSVTGLDFGGRPVNDPGGRYREKAEAELAAIGDATVVDPVTGLERPMTFAERNAAIEGVVNQYYTDTARYDERYFDLTSPRGNVQMSGIYEQNPYGVGNTSTLGTQGTLPSTGSTVRSDIQTPKEDSVNYGNAEYADINESTIPGSTTGDGILPDDGRELVLGETLPDDWEWPKEELPSDQGWFPSDNYEFTQNEIPDSDKEDIPTGGGGGGAYTPDYVDAGGGGDFEPDWSELFPYTKLTPLQKKALRPYVGLIAAMRQGAVA